MSKPTPQKTAQTIYFGFRQVAFTVKADGSHEISIIPRHPAKYHIHKWEKRRILDDKQA